MKTKLLMGLFAICGIANAQITITQADIAGWGAVIRQASDTLPGGTIKPGGSGNQTWNFSALNTHLTDTLTFSNPTLLAGYSGFPSSNLGLEQKGQTQNNQNIFWTINSDSLNLIGAYFPSGLSLQLNPIALAMKFPSTYPAPTLNSTWGFDFKYPYTQSPTIDTIRSKRAVVINGSIDAYGNVTTPLGTFNTIRAKGYTTETDSVWGHDFTNNTWPLLQTTSKIYYQFSWYANGMGWAVAEMDSMISPNPGAIKNAQWLKSTTVTGINELSLKNDVVVFPNPFSSQTVLQTENLLKNATLTVYNSRGQTVKQIKNIQGQTVTLSRDNLASGLYFIRLTENNKIITADKLVITD